MYSACLAGVMKEFSNGNGVIYVNKPEDVLKKAVELIENKNIGREGKKGERLCWKTRLGNYYWWVWEGFGVPG